MDLFQIITLLLLTIILALSGLIALKLPGQGISRKQARPILVDTSVLIDGRIVPVAKSGFIGDSLVIPRSVVGELQFLADNADHDKRARARYGLDVVSELQSIPHMTIHILQDSSRAQEGVDDRLLSLAKKQNAAICTIDYNLNKVAVVEGITVLNVNELAQGLRMAYLPGERMQLEIVQKGQDAHQGVGYLSDGTMVVVENASKLIGQSVDVEIIRSLQTAAGKMMFARKTERQQTAKLQSQKPMQSKKQAAATQIKDKPEQQKRPTVFHSDSRDQQLSKKPTKPQYAAKKQAAPSRPRSQQKPAPRGKDHESTILELVDKQAKNDK